MINLDISSLKDALSLPKNHNYDAIFSLIDSCHYEYGLNIKNNCSFHVLELFADTENCNDPQAISKIQVERIIKIFEYLILKNRIIKHVLIHCFAGVSRSTAFGIIFLYMQGVSVEDAFNKIKKQRGSIQPNLLILSYADEIFKLLGEESLVYQIGLLNDRGDTSFVYNGF